MLLTLDVGNSQIFCGVHDGDALKTTFRRTSSIRASSDEFGTFFRATLRENGIDPEQIDMTAICSVVPDAVHSLRNCFRKYFRFEPFVLQPGAKTGLKIRYRNPLEVGADKIANAIGALTRFPGRNLLIVDFGTATTLDHIGPDGAYLGGIIAPGVNLSLEALVAAAAKLPRIAIEAPATDSVIGRTTESQMLIGVYWGYVSMMEGLIARMKAEIGKPLTVVATGGLATLFQEQAHLFDRIEPDLTLNGLMHLYNQRKTII